MVKMLHNSDIGRGTTLDVFMEDSDDELPAGWEERVTHYGDVYYANHNLKTTQWTHPISGTRKRVPAELPYGWVREEDSETNDITFVDTINNRHTTTDPRLAFKEHVDINTGLPKHDTKSGVFTQVFDGNSRAMEVLAGRDHSGVYAIVTGATSGIGFETVRSLALHGAHVVLTGRSLDLAKKMTEKIITEHSKARVVPGRLKLHSFSDVAEFCQWYKENKWPLNLLILNAGIYCPPYEISSDGIELTMRVNHIGHFHLVSELIPLMIESKKSSSSYYNLSLLKNDDALSSGKLDGDEFREKKNNDYVTFADIPPSTLCRIITLTSESHRFANLSVENFNSNLICRPSFAEYGYGLLAYNNSKLANILMSMELHRRLCE